MLRLKGSKTIAAALAGGLALMAAGISTAQADDDWNGNGWNHGKHWKKHGHGWGPGPVVVRNGYYYAPPPRVYYAPPPAVYYEAPPRVYYAPPPPVYVVPQPQPAISLQFRL
ncbi:hypothetical protein [Dongia sp. agr-C8]